ncbi:Beta-agarase AgaB34 [Tetrabaena socialis]|uniref:Beta-agarase AgaB34 n=1 Tax=Tetrabaena socialis TaxID=47790 RepID=A0A2J7ZT61_9CHLO|nr:Beta-agarase AgaB34 [Tetrabaena socialis]|eukprot:PNH03457.1 Beta-agarase AgaB34 [Tetrabaena socialis]
MCIDVPSGNQANGIQLQLFDCNPSPAAQQFTITPVDDAFAIKSIAGKAFDVSNSSTNAGARIQLWDFGSSQTNQLWYIQDVGGSFYRFVNKNSGKCIDLSENKAINGAAIQQWDCLNNDAQRFKMEWIHGRELAQV